MISFFFSGVLFWLGVIIAKKIEFYFKARIAEMRIIQEEADRKAEYVGWKEHRLPYLKRKMRGEVIDRWGNVVEPDKGYEKEIDKESDKTWALAERLARSNHMRKSWDRFGPIEETQYDF